MPNGAICQATAARREWAFLPKQECPSPSRPARCGGVRFLQLRRAFLAAHLDGLPADRHLDCVVVELVVAGRAGLLVHELPPVNTRSPGISSRPPRDAGPLSRS